MAFTEGKLSSLHPLALALNPGEGVVVGGKFVLRALQTRQGAIVLGIDAQQHVPVRRADFPAPKIVENDADPTAINRRRFYATNTGEEVMIGERNEYKLVYRRQRDNPQTLIVTVDTINPMLETVAQVANHMPTENILAAADTSTVPDIAPFYRLQPLSSSQEPVYAISVPLLSHEDALLINNNIAVYCSVPQVIEQVQLVIAAPNDMAIIRPHAPAGNPVLPDKPGYGAKILGVPHIGESVRVIKGDQTYTLTVGEKVTHIDPIDGTKKTGMFLDVTSTTPLDPNTTGGLKIKGMSRSSALSRMLEQINTPHIT